MLRASYSHQALTQSMTASTSTTRYYNKCVKQSATGFRFASIHACVRRRKHDCARRYMHACVHASIIACMHIHVFFRIPCFILCIVRPMQGRRLESRSGGSPSHCSSGADICKSFFFFTISSRPSALICSFLSLAPSRLSVGTAASYFSSFLGVAFLSVLDSFVVVSFG